MNTPHIHQAAVEAAQAGLSVVPPRHDASKAPAAFWTEFQSRCPSLAEIDDWYGSDEWDGVGLVTGKVSGNLELFEFEGRAVTSGLWDEFVATAVTLGLGDVLDRVREGYCEGTPSGGIHLLWRCLEIGPSQKLAQSVDADATTAVLIETKGEAGYVVVAPSGRRVHPSGGTYNLQSGGFTTIAEITPEERTALLELARSFDQAGIAKATHKAVAEWKSSGRPGDEYIEFADWDELLTKHGWTRLHTGRDGNVHWRRPDKTIGTSGTVSADEKFLYVFSTSTPFEAERAYNLFGAYAVLEHGGDFAAAASALHAEGYGDEPSRPSTAAKETKGKVSQSKLLVDLALDRYRFASAPDGRPFGVLHEGTSVARMLRGGRNSLRAELADAFYDLHGKVPTQGALADAMNVLEGRAVQQIEDVNLRVARVDDRLLVDLGTSTGEVVTIGADGWEILHRSPVLFERTALSASLPTPVHGGQLDELRELLNVDDSSWTLLVGWLVAAFFADIPHPIMALLGEQGTAKTSTAKICASLIDPSVAQVQAAPHESGKWAVTANGSWVIALDNVSRIPEWLSDALCKAVTGDGYIQRRLYTDADLTVIEFRRAIIITAIDTGELRGDLADRMVPIELERIPPTGRRTEQDLKQAWTAMHPRVLGALFDLTAQVLAVLPDISLDKLPRMADFARMLAAIDQTTGFTSLETYQGLDGRLAHDVIESEPVAQALVTFMQGRTPWTGTANTLLPELTPEHPPKGWPDTPRKLAGALRRAAPHLRQVCIEVDFGRTANARLITITNTAEGPKGEWKRPTMTVVTVDDGIDPHTVIVPRGGDQGERLDDDGSDGSDGLHPLFSYERREEEENEEDGDLSADEYDDVIARMERELDAVIVAEYPLVAAAA